MILRNKLLKKINNFVAIKVYEKFKMNKDPAKFKKYP